ncbi:MAG: hypothetical protein N2378_12365 [Chloroflexaceae bacterium]|nr:hypothetical protein [Chloroflexaceae bacterium]
MNVPDPRTLAWILPIRAADAWAWAEGRLQDEDLYSRLELEHPGAVYAARLPSPAAWRGGLLLTWFWWRRGARLFVTRTGVPSLLGRYRAHGAIITHVGPRERPGQVRLAIGEDGIRSFFRMTPGPWTHLLDAAQSLAPCAA